MAKFLFWGPLAFIVTFCFAAFAQVKEPVSVDQALELLPVLVGLFQEGKFLAAGAVLTLILVFGFRKFMMPKLALGAGILPIVSSALGVVVGFAVSILGKAELNAAILAMLSGPAAGVLWDSVVKYFFKKPGVK